MKVTPSFSSLVNYHTKLSRASVRRKAYVPEPSNLRIGLHTNVFSRPQLEDRRKIS